MRPFLIGMIATVTVVLPDVRAQVTTVPACIELLEKPTYPRLARMAAIQGTVAVHLLVTSDRISTEFAADANPLLVPEVASALHKTQFPAECYGSHNLVFKFVLEGEPAYEAHTSVIVNPPNEYVVRSNRTGVVDVYYSQVQRKCWIKRLFGRF